MKYKEIDGDLIKLALEGHFDVITHGCNCFNIMGGGIAPIMHKNFGCNDFPMEQPKYKGSINKLGTIDYKLINNIYVVNSYTQYGLGKDENNNIPLNYNALALCMTKINHTFKNKRIGLPLIGCGLAGGDWNIVKDIIQKNLIDCDITIVKFK